MSSLLDKKLILVVGKGGVGRSTVSAALARGCAQRGRRTLLFEANAKDRLGAFMGKAELDEKLRELDTNLFGINTTPDHALEEYGMMVLRFRKVYRMVFENRITQAFLKAVPGIEDYSLLGKAWHHTKETRRGKDAWDTLIFDMAASGHSLSMLRIPWAITDAVPEGPLTRDARAIKALIQDPDRCAVVIVTMAEDMPSNEATELSEQLATHLGVQPALVVVNQVYPDWFPPESVQTKTLDAIANQPGDLGALAAHGTMAQARRSLNESYLARLRERFKIPLSIVYRRFVSELTPADISEIGEQFTAELG